MRRLLLLFLTLCVTVLPTVAQDIEIETPPVVLRDVPFDVNVRGLAPSDSVALVMQVRVGEATYPLAYVADEGTLRAEGVRTTGRDNVIVVERDEDVLAQATARTIPGWFSILPPLLAIAIALLFKRVIPALFLGIWVGAWIAAGGVFGWFFGLFDAFQIYVRDAMSDPDHVSIILFTLMIGGMVGIISKSGGMQGVVNRIVAWARTPRKGQIATAILGLVIFFDDYANTLVVGNTMRPVTDRLKVSWTQRRRPWRVWRS